MGWKLWLDDLYDDPDSPERHPPEGFIPAKSSAHAMSLIMGLGMPEFISFDHDLGGEDNGSKFLDMLINYYWYDKIVVPDYQVHSANPVGSQNIVAKMESWRRSQEL